MKTVQLAVLLQFSMLMGLLPQGAAAQTWDELLSGGGDAPALLPGQITAGGGPLVTLTGAIANPDSDPDLYCIRITDPASFSATTVGSTEVDLSLWLFDAGGLGVAHDGADDTNAGPNAGYQASLTSQFVSQAGIFFLAVTRGGVDALSSGGEIWADLPTVERSPDGPGAPGPLTGWTFPGFGLPGAYAVQLTGAAYHIPEPSSVVLAVVGACGALLRRRGHKVIVDRVALV